MCCRLIQDTALSKHLPTALMVPTDQKTGERLDRNGCSLGCSSPPCGAAGADNIDDVDVLRHGAMTEVFGGIRAPSTLGSFLRSFA